VVNEKQHIPLRIERLPDGGFVVSETASFDRREMYYPQLFACTDIGEALNFIRERLTEFGAR